MSSGRRFKRVGSLVIGDGEITINSSDLRLQFEVNRSLNDARSSTVSITNLTPFTAERIAENDVFELTAGYEGEDGLLIRGAISSVNSRREGNERITTITVSTGKDMTGLYFERSYDEGANLHLVLADVAELMELKLGDLSLIPNRPTPNYASSGSVALVLDGATQNTGATWFIEDGFLQFVPIDFNPGDGGTGVYTVNEAGGMKDTPTVTAEGAQVTTLLDPRIRVRSGIQLESEALSGLFRVTEIVHRGDTWDGAFDTELTLIR